MSRAAFTRAAVLVAVAAYAASYLDVASPVPLIFGLVSQIIFILPGVLILRAIAPAQGWLPALAFGPLLGQALGCLVMTGLWVAGGRGVWLLIATPILVSILVPFAGRLRDRWRLPSTDPADAVALALLALLVPIVAGLPFAHVGELTPDGQAYRAYFTADYVWRRAVVIELAKGASPLPVNPFFDGDVMRYYWMPHILSGVQYRFAQTWASLDALLLIRSISIDFLFVAFLYGMVRAFRVRPWAAALGVTFVVLSTSFEGLYALFDYSSKNVPINAVTSLNIDGITRWYFQGIPVDGLQRVLFYQPHHIVGYVIGLMGLLAIALRTKPIDAAAFAVSGICLGLSVVISSFAALMVTVAAAFYELIGVIRARDIRRALTHAIATAIPLLVSVAVVFGLGYVDRSGKVLELIVNPVAMHRFWWVTLLSFGPVIVAVIAAIPAIQHERRGLSMFGALAITSVLFYFFVNVRDHQYAYVGWRVGHFLFMSAAVIIGVAVEYIARSPSAFQPVQAAAIAIAFLTGLPTTIIDIYNTQDITNFREAAAGHMTLLVRPDERQAFDWIRDNSPPESRFQVDPLARGAEFWAYLPAFAARRMSVGLPISMVPLAKYEQGSAEIAKIFEETPLAAYERAARARVNYVLIGETERNAHPGIEDRFNSIPNQMPLAFKNGTIAIYEVK